MSATSNLMYVDRMVAEPLDEFQPCSAYRAWATRNNLAHLIDESTQVRINWIGTSVNGATYDTYLIAGTSEGSLTSGTTRRVWAQEFVHTWLGSDKPANLDLHVRIATTGDTTPTLNVLARVVPASFPVGDDSAPVFVEAVAETTTSDTADAVVDAQLQLTGAPGFDAYTDVGFTADEEGVFISIRAAMMRLEIVLDEDTNVSTARHEIVAVLLREYA